MSSEICRTCARSCDTVEQTLESIYTSASCRHLRCLQLTIANCDSMEKVIALSKTRGNPINNAIDADAVNVVIYLAQSGFEVSPEVFMTAAMRGNTCVLDSLITLGFSPPAEIAIEAAGLGYTLYIQFLIKRCLDIDPNAGLYAMMYGYRDITLMIINSGYTVASETAYYAARAHDFEVIEAMINRKIAITPADISSVAGLPSCSEFVQLLMNNGYTADSTAITNAISRRDLELAEYLTIANAPIDIHEVSKVTGDSRIIDALRIALRKRVV